MGDVRSRRQDRGSVVLVRNGEEAEDELLQDAYLQVDAEGSFENWDP